MNCYVAPAMPSTFLYVMTKRTSKFFFTKSNGFILEQTYELGFRELKIRDSAVTSFVVLSTSLYFFWKIYKLISLVNDFGHEEPFEVGNHP